MTRPRLALTCIVLLAIGCSAASTGPAPAPVTPDAWQPPGADPYAAELLARLAVALSAKGPDYVPRTHHTLEGGAPKYNNRLILESSPYLLQHAHNPVNWYPWGDEAFETARSLGRPVLLSIGYSTCHWCHVMEEESFEDEEIAAYLNANYIAIKVDREERPDLDAIYMSAVQMLTGRGGWPMTTWLTPDRQPFYGGTYFPARDGDRGSRVGFLSLLAQLKQQYDEKPDEIVAQATKLVGQIARQMRPGDSGSIPGNESVDEAVALFARNFDPVHGGMKRSPKFPSSLPVRTLLRHYNRTGEENTLHMATFSLRKMAAGGMYDQVGGGFHRYSVDAKWLVPHFEKMLYDNALLTMAYVEAYQTTGEEEFAETAREVLDYVTREMTAPLGGFYSATDADSLAPNGEREEGWFFTWTLPEIEAVVDAEVAQALRLFYGANPRGNYEGRNILHRSRSVPEVAALLKISSDQLAERLAAGKKALYQERSGRPAPLRDDKILTSWNGLMVSAFAQGGFVLDRPDYIATARRAARFALDQRDERGRLFRSYNVGEARHAAFLDDYAFLTAGLLDLYEATSEIEWLDEAIALQAILDRHYATGGNGGYFMTSDDHESLLAREKPNRDGAEPSGNSIALMNLLRLHELTTLDGYRKSAEKLLAGFGADLTRRPTSLSEMLMGLAFWNDSAKEVVIVTPGGREQAEGFIDVLRKTYLPNKVIVVVPQGKKLKEHSQRVPWIKGKVARRGEATAYVCEQGICQLPTTDVAVFAEQLVERGGQFFDE